MPSIFITKRRRVRSEHSLSISFTLRNVIPKGMMSSKVSGSVTPKIRCSSVFPSSELEFGQHSTLSFQTHTSLNAQQFCLLKQQKMAQNIQYQCFRHKEITTCNNFYLATCFVHFSCHQGRIKGSASRAAARGANL
jgi:hypothetical protein